MHEVCLAQQAIYPLGEILPPVDRYFLEPGCASRPPPSRGGRENGGRVGVRSASNGPDARGGFHLFVPDATEGDARPLVVALHGGQIRVESDGPDTGTTFTVLLPALAARLVPGENAPVSSGEWKTSGTILIVDDDQTVRRHFGDSRV